MAGKALAVVQNEIVLADGIVAIPTDVLRAMPVQDYARNGVVLANERIKAFVMHGEGDDKRPVEYTISVYVQRSALTDDEANGVKAKALDGDTKKKTRAEEEQAKKEREIARAFELGQSATLGAMNNIGTLVAASQAISKLK